MKDQRLKEICTQSCVVIKEVAAFIKEELGKVKSGDIEEKSKNSLVSYVDKTSEKMLVDKLGDLLPEATFLTEEATVETKEGIYQWIIDPLDGTTNFLFQLPFFAISVALRHEDKIILGIVYEVNRDECFYAWKNGGAYLNEEKIQVSSTQSPADALFATGFPYEDFEKLEASFSLLRYIIKDTRGIRRFGSAALDLAFVACGRFELYFEYSLNAWDVAAGALIVQEAGGVVSDFKGGNNYLFGREILAGNKAIYASMQPKIQKSFHA